MFSSWWRGFRGSEISLQSEDPSSNLGPFQKGEKIKKLPVLSKIEEDSVFFRSAENSFSLFLSLNLFSHISGHSIRLIAAPKDTLLRSARPGSVAERLAESSFSTATT